MNDSDDDSWLKIGQTFGKKEENKLLTNKRKAEDFFSSDSESEKLEIKEQEEQIENIQHNKKFIIARQKKLDITKNYLVKNLFEIEDQKKYLIPQIQKNYAKSTSENIYCAEEILESLQNLSVNKKRRFLNKFELKKIKLHDSDILFTIDNIPIEDNYKYGSLQKKEIPIFKRFPTNRIGGIKNLKLSREIMTELNEMIGIYRKDKNLKENKKLRYYDSNYISNFLNPNAIKIFKRKNFDHEKTFLPFINEEKEIQKLSEEDDVMNLKIDYNLFESITDKFLLEQNRNLNKRINENPNNIKFWFDLINFQDDLNFLKNEKSKMEIKLNILEKSLKIKENEDNLILNLLYLRILEDFDYDNFENLNTIWMNKLKILSSNKKFLAEYLTFLKTRKKLNINILRDYYLNIIKFYENLILESENDKLLYSFYIIDIIVDLIILEKGTGFYEKSFNLLRTFLELICLKFKNILKDKFFDDYVNYFESEYPKIGDFENGMGFIDYIQNKDTINLEYFNKNDFIENYRNNDLNNLSNDSFNEDDTLSNFINFEKMNKNYRSLNFLFDKDKIEKFSESYIFYSDIKDYVDIKIIINEDIILYFLNSIKKFIGIPNQCFCINCTNDIFNNNYLRNMPKIISDDNNELKFIFDEKFMFFKKLKSLDNQLYIYFIRLYDYILNLNILNENVLLMKLDLIFLYKNNTAEFKFNYIKSLLKDNQNNFGIWFNYYNWCLFFNKYEDAEKVIRLISQKNIEYSIENQIDLNLEEYIRIKNFSISHYIYNILLGNSKYNLEEFNVLIMAHLQFIFDILNLGSVNKTFKNENISLLENVLKNFNSFKLSKNLYSLILTLLTSLIFISTGNISTINKLYLINKFKLISNYVNLIEINLKNYDRNNICRGDSIKQNISLFFTRIFYLIRKYNSIINTPKFTIEFLENLNNFHQMQNDIFIIQLCKHLCHFSNPIDREIKFISIIGNNSSLKYFYYFLNTKFSKEIKAENISIALNYFKNYWNLYNNNLYKISNTSDTFTDSKLINKYDSDKNYLSINNIENTNKILYYYFQDLLEIIKKGGIGELHHILDYSLFLIHEYSYNKKLYLKILFECHNLIKNINLIDEQKELIKKHIKHLMDILKLKEIRVYGNLEI